MGRNGETFLIREAIGLDGALGAGLEAESEDPDESEDTDFALSLNDTEPSRFVLDRLPQLRSCFGT